MLLKKRNHNNNDNLKSVWAKYMFNLFYSTRRFCLFVSISFCLFGEIFKIKMGSGSYFFREVLPLVALVTAEFVDVGQNTIFKAAVSKGLSYHVFMVYSYAIFFLVLLPLAFLSHRRTQLPPFTIVLVGKFFLLGFLGFAAQQLGYLGISYSNPIMGSAMSNLSPASTFALAVLFRMEKLKLSSMSSQAKIVGTLMSISGALIVVLYNGPILITDHDEKQTPTNNTIRNMSSAKSDWIIGGALLAGCHVISSFWYICQAKYVGEYPSEFIVVLFYSFFAFLLSVPVGIVSEPRLSAWKLPADVRLLSVLYSGIMGTGFVVTVHTWGLHVKGPVYVALFRPLSIAIAVMLGVIFLGEGLSLGSVIGSVVITVGFYTVMWAKTKEEITEPDNLESSTNDEIAPLLVP